jgi:nucleoside transporter
MGVRVRLSLMMFLQFMLLPVWFLPLAPYMDGMGIGATMKALILSSMALGLFAAPIIGMVADRYFASEKVLAVLNLACSALLFFAPQQKSPTALFVVLLLIMFCYMPTWGLTSAIAMANSPAEKFPQIRVFGSIGWVASGVFSLAGTHWFKVQNFDSTHLTFYCGAGAAVVAALVALALPATPPKAKGQAMSVMDALGLRSLTLMKHLHFAMYIVIALLATIPFAIYWSYCSVFLKDKGFQYITVTMNWGQFAEMFFMLIVPLAMKKIGVKWAMVIGLVAMLARYVAFLCGGMFGMDWLYFVGILVHGLIFGFFYVGGQIYVDKVAPVEIRAQAQGFNFLATFGLGLLIGNFFNGALIQHYKVAESYNWDAIWGWTTAITAVLLVAFAVLFNPPTESATEKAQ